MSTRCRVCGVQAQTDRRGRCRLCREVKAAADAGTSYGRYKSDIYMRYGDQPEIPLDWYKECPICHKLFLPRRRNQIYDANACAQRAASKKYYKNKRAGRLAPADQMEDGHGPNTAYQDGGRSHKIEPVAKSKKI